MTQNILYTDLFGLLIVQTLLNKTFSMEKKLSIPSHSHSYILTDN